MPSKACAHRPQEQLRFELDESGLYYRRIYRCGKCGQEYAGKWH